MTKQHHSAPFAQGVLASPQLKRNFIQWLHLWNRWQTKLYLDDLSTAACQLRCRTEDLVELLDYFVFIEHSSLQNINLDMHLIDAVFQMRERRAGTYHPDEWNPIPANEHKTRPLWRKINENLE